METNKKNLFVSIIDAVFIVIVTIFIFLIPELILKSPELGCVISSGTYMLDNFSLSPQNIFTFTELNNHWVNANWLSDCIFAMAYKLGGYEIVLFFTAILIGLLFTAVFWSMVKNYPNWLCNITLLVLGIIASSNNLEAGNRIFSFLIALVLVYALDNLRADSFSKKWFITICLLMLLWVNLNTDFILGMLIILTYSVSYLFEYYFYKRPECLKYAKYTAILILISIALTLFNPYGIKLMAMIVNYYTSGLFLNNGFLSSPNFHETFPFRFYELFILILIFLGLFSSYKPPLVKVLLVVLFLFLSLYSAINIPFFIIVSLLLISDILKNTDITFNIALLKKLLEMSKLQGVYVKPILPVIFSIILLISMFLYPQFYNSFSRLDFMPEEAADYIAKNHNDGNIFNPYGWGCYLHNQLNCKVYITERMYHVSPEHSEEYNKIINVYDVYEEKLEKNNIKWVIMPVTEKLSLTLKKNKHWKKVYNNNTNCVYMRVNTDKDSDKQ